MRETEMKELL